MSLPSGILLINGPLPPPYGGVSTYLAHALPHLCRSGFNVHTVMDKRPKDPTAYRVFEEAGVQIHYGGGTRWRKGLRWLRYLPLWWRYAREARLPLSLLIRSTFSLVSWIDAADRVLRSESIDIVHAYDYPWVQGFVAATLAKRYRKIFVQTTFGEVVPHVSELEQHDALGEQFRRISGAVLSRCDLVIAMSEHCARELSYVGVPRERVRVTYYGIDLKVFRPENDGADFRRRHQLGARPVVLFLGHLRLRKGPQVLLEAIPGIVAQAKEAVVVFAGPDYDLKARLERRAEELSVTGHVRFLGPLSDADVRAAYAACDVFAFPTCTPIECLGLSMVQAMATGKPVVGSNINGIPEVIVDGETGYLVPPNDPAALASRIGYLLVHDEERKSLGKKALMRAQERFDQGNLVEELAAIYRGLLSRSPMMA